MPYTASDERYAKEGFYKRCGRSGLKLPRISLGLWHNFGDNFLYEASRSIVLRCFDLGITHFDLANNYGPPAGAAETTFGRILAGDLAAYRDELVISTKAGYGMWEGPYGDFGSRKYLLASLDQSLQRMGLEYVDIFYHHRPDPETPLEETMGALDHAVRSGKALYVGISNYSPEDTARAASILRALGTPLLIHQPKYNLFHRAPEDGLFDTLQAEGVGCIPFCPLAQGLLTNRYLDGIPADARASRDPRFLKQEHVTAERLAILRALNELALERGQSLAQLALLWVLRHPAVTTALIGASKPSQVEDNVAALEKPQLSPGEIDRIEAILAG